MTDNFADDIRRHNEMIEALGKLWLRQGEINDEQRAMNQRLDGYMARLDGFMQQQVVFNGDLKTTLARIETLLARLPRGEENGREA